MTETNVPAQASDEPMLLPCPLCGGAATVQTEFRTYGHRAIECTECGANVGAVDLDRGVAMWNARTTPRATADVERDAARWNETLMHIGGMYTDVGAKRFTLRYLNPVEGTDIMRGGVAGHFTAAIDAARADRLTWPTATKGAKP